MIRSFIIALALACAGAFPSAADDLPQGEFLLAAQIVPDEFLARYVTLAIEGDRIDVILSSRLPLDYEACMQDQLACVYRQIAATARAALDGGELQLQDVAIQTDAVIEEQFRHDAPLYTLITEPLVEVLEKTQFTPTDTGFTLTANGTSLPFYRATTQAQQAIMVFPFMMEMSIRTLGGCEVAAIAPQFEAGGTAFTDALLAATRVHDLVREADALAPITRDVSAEDEQRASRLNRIASLPQMLAFATDPGPLEPRVEALWTDGPGAAMFNNDRQAFDEAVAGFGSELEPLVGFLTHLRTSGAQPTAEAACGDPSFGFLAAQGG